MIPPSKIGMPLQPQNSTARNWKMMAKKDYFQGLAASCQISGKYTTGWWFQPLWKNLVKLDHFPSKGENKKCLKPPPKQPFNTFNTWSFHAHWGLMPRTQRLVQQDLRSFQSKQVNFCRHHFLGTIFDLRNPPTFWVDSRPEVPVFLQKYRHDCIYTWIIFTTVHLGVQCLCQITNT